MQYEEFVNYLINEIKTELGDEDVIVDNHLVTKNNGIKRDGITVKFPDSQVAPTVYVQDFYDMYQNGRSLNDIVNRVVESVKHGKDFAPQMPELSKQSAKENMYCTLVNLSANEEMLKDVPYEQLEDLAVVARFKVGEEASFLVNDAVCKQLQMTGEEVLQIAHANTEKQDFEIKTIGEVIGTTMGEDLPPEIAESFDIYPDGKCPMWVLSNESKVDGAVAITSDKVLKTAHEKLGEDYWVLPSSRHEVILVPESMVTSWEELEAMVREVNATQVDPIDKLSDRVYQYDGQKLSLAETHEKSLESTLILEKSMSHARSH